MTFSIAAGAHAEEQLFRGFVFQRLVASGGTWVAQLAASGLFLLTHLNNPGMADTFTLLPMANILNCINNVWVFSDQESNRVVGDRDAFFSKLVSGNVARVWNKWPSGWKHL